MNTVIRNWCIVSVFDGDILIRKVLWGYVIDDSSCRFLKDDFVCTSNIIRINITNELITTQSGSLYQVLDKGSAFKLDIEEFELLRIGFSPSQIEALRISSGFLKH